MGDTIKSIEAIPVGLPFTQHQGQPAGFGGKIWETLDNLLVRVETSDGIVGWGDAFAYNALSASKAALEDQVAPLATGKPADDNVGLMAGLGRALHNFGRSGATQFALSGLDIALWDIAGKRAGSPVAHLLGGGTRSTIPAYASLFRISDHDVLKRVCEKLVADGYEAIKLHEVDPIAALVAREASGSDTALMMDVNCPWDLTAAKEAASTMVPANLKWLEEPIWPPEDFTSLSALTSSGIPIAAGENTANPEEMKRLAETPKLAYAQPSVTKIGGISAFHQAAQSVERAGKRLAPHSPYFGPGLLATLQMAAVFPGVEYVEIFGATLTTPLFDGYGLPKQDQQFAIPTKPGLGADPITDVIERYRLD